MFMTKIQQLPISRSMSFSFKRPHLQQRWSWAFVFSMLVVLLILMPIGLLVSRLLNFDLALWQQLLQTVLPTMTWNTLVLVAGVGIGTFVIGTGYAWLVSAYDFPLRGLFEKALLLPLAVPTFVMGFVWMATFDYAGPVQTWWRSMFGREAYFPDIHSAGGVIIVMTLVLYPYVYILARSAFNEQSANTVEAARVMGLNRKQTFLRLVLPMARPSLAAGAILAMMEALTDYGAVKFMSYPTLSEGIVRIWEGRMERDSAIQIAVILLLFGLGLMILERMMRGRAKYYQTSMTRGRRPQRHRLQGIKMGFAMVACLALLGVAFIMPAGQLIGWTLAELNKQTVGGWESTYLTYISNSITFAGVAAFVVVFFGTLVAHGVRSLSMASGARQARWIARLVTLGYAMPGAVIAVGVLLFLSPIDFSINDLAKQLGLQRPGLILTGSMTGLIYAYLVRFMSVGYNSVDSSLEKITPNMEQSARTLGARPSRILWRIYAPLMSSGMAAGALLVFVDVMKELPATLMLRPFGMDTLALWAYFLASESFWQAAALPSLTIVAVGLLPIVLLMRVGDKR
jgi:iron(III) transport system permease protein